MLVNENACDWLHFSVSPLRSEQQGVKLCQPGLGFGVATGPTTTKAVASSILHVHGMAAPGSTPNSQPTSEQASRRAKQMHKKKAEKQEGKKARSKEIKKERK